MPKRLPVTIVCFHIMAILLVAVIIAIIAIAQPFGQMANEIQSDGHSEIPSMVFSGIKIVFIIIPVMLFLFALGLELVVRGLNRRSYWAWIVGLVVCGFLILGGMNNYGITLVIGGLALWGLVDPETVAAFRPVQPPSPSGESGS